MSAVWQHNPPELLTAGVPWRITLQADGSLAVSCDIEELTFTLHVASAVVLELGNAIRRAEVARVIKQGGAR